MKNKMHLCCVSNLQTFTARIYFFLHFLLASLPQLALAQFEDDFTDGNFSTGPSWRGNDSLFLVADGQLLLNGMNQDGVAYMSTPSTLIRPASWEFEITYGFNPSSNNYTQVFLVADEPDLTTSLNGYFVMIGNARDEVSLYKQTGSAISEIIDGRDDLLNTTTVAIKIKVTHDENGWRLFTAAKSSDSFTLEGASEDDAISTSEYFGIVCHYTATRSDKISFDNFLVKPTSLTEETGPDLNELQVISSTELQLTFSEPLNPSSASAVENYFVNNDIGHPTSATLKSDHVTVLLAFDKTFSTEKYSVLSISDLQDLSGYTAEIIEANFIYILPSNVAVKDIVITEIFPDPSPSVGLQESEFVEIYNRTDNAVNLSEWSVTDGSSVATLPDVLFLPKEYLVLTNDVNDTLGFDKAIYLQDFPSLNNSEDMLIIKDGKGETIDSINYSLAWYRDNNKAQGGWTLEIIDPDNICSGHENWSASESNTGGTPGFTNSVMASNPDLAGPQLLSAIPIDSREVHLRFNEKLQAHLPASLDITFQPDMPVSSVSLSNAALTELSVLLSEELNTGITYSISVANLADCAGNVIQAPEAEVRFGLPEQADSADVLINEILFNPRPTGVDFVEIFNASSKYINLKNWSLANFENGTLINHVTITTQELLLMPADFLAITDNAALLKGEYLSSLEQNFLQIANLPPFNDDEGSVALINDAGQIIDSFLYNKEMHSIFIKDDEGVSLERILNSESSTLQNWRSASSTVGFATPGYVNSNAIQPPVSGNFALMLDPEIFNPVSGQGDFTLVHYRFDQGGYVANVRVYDSHGRTIKEIANNDILGTQGFYRWEGDRDDGSKAGVGYYMVWMEVFDSQGSVKTYRNRVAIASSFE